MPNSIYMYGGTTSVYTEPWPSGNLDGQWTEVRITYDGKKRIHGRTATVEERLDTLQRQAVPKGRSIKLSGDF